MSSPTPCSTRLRFSRLAAACGLLALLCLPASLLGQGCVIARGGGGACVAGDSGYLEAGHWQTNVALRWFKSHRHFAGDDEQTQRERDGTEVINDSYFYDFTATYAWTKRLNLSLTLPFVHHDRSSMYEHLGNSSGQRFHTQAQGLADLRGSFAYWIRNPDTARGWNVSFGLGLKAPSGRYTVTDTFIRSTGPQTRFVDSSIQPGDGGWGVSADLQGFAHLSGPWSAYGSASYLFNPRERVTATNYSVPDSYLARGGFEYMVAPVPGLSLTLGGRIEGVPGSDAFGGSLGSRRPGFAVAVEPGLTFTHGRYAAALTVPYAVHRRRSTTYGQAKAGDAAFADYSVTSSFSIKL